jgi:hypothetical protein
MANTLGWERRLAASGIRSAKRKRRNGLFSKNKAKTMGNKSIVFLLEIINDKTVIAW